jgi:signal transduction histidine kinase
MRPEHVTNSVNFWPDETPSDAGQDPKSEKHSPESLTHPPAREPHEQFQIPFSVPAEQGHEPLSSDEKLRAIMTALPITLFAVDCNAIVTLFEGKGAESHHVNHEQVVGRSLFDVYPDLPETRKQLANALAGHGGRSMDRLGSQSFETIFSPLEDGKGRVVGALGIRIEATAPGSANELNNFTGQSDDLRNRYLALASHELRTPLNSIVGFVNLLLKNKEARFDEEDLFHLNRILGNATHLLNVVTHMLDISAVGAGKLSLTVSKTDVGKLIRETMDELRGHEGAGSLRMVAEIPEDVLSIDTDRQMLKQVLVNLLGNALKYTERGSITVRLDIDAHCQPVRICVVDTGGGIPKDKLDSIFEAFVRIDQATGQDVEGTGLGLTFSRSLCDLMGYTIGVESALGRGSTFTIHLTPGPQPQLS